MKLNINEKAEQELLAMPESGPGFQIVEAWFRGEKSTYIVWNAEFAIDLKDAPISTENFIGATLGSWINEQALSSVTIISAPSLHNFSLLGARVHSSASTGVSGSSAVSPPPSPLVKTVTLKKPRMFYRFSRFSTDRRVDRTTGDFLPAILEKHINTIYNRKLEESYRGGDKPNAGAISLGCTQDFMTLTREASCMGRL